MINKYHTIAEPSTGSFRDRGSKFLAYAFPIHHADDIKVPLTQLRKEHIKAVHFCYAYIIGTDGNNYRANDDGEPSGSAGKPILNQIISASLTNICVVVVRYFGGTLLGVPGLINAYKSATAIALDEAVVIEKIVTRTIHLTFDYPHIGEVMKWIKQTESLIIHQDMALACDITLEVPLDYEDHLRKLIEDYNIYQDSAIITKD